MMLSELVPEKKLPVDVEIQGITDDSRCVKAGDLFCALSGESFDGRSFVADAVNRGAVAVVCEPPAPDTSVPVVAVENLRARLGDFASRVHGDPSHDVEVIAVTGTNGKTSFTHLLAQALTVVGLPTGLIGTMGYGKPESLKEPGLTTPAAVDLQYKVKQLTSDECLAIVLEASSHGLAQGRLNGLAVDTAVLTNLTLDHRDYHATLEDYRAAKQRLFEKSSLRNAVLNFDDEFGRDLAPRLGSWLNVVTYSRTDSVATVHCRSVDFGPDGLSLQLIVNTDRVSVELPLFGKFNVENVLAVAAAMLAMGYLVADIELVLNRLKPVAGRMDIVSRADKPCVIVDYAHTPDALQKALQAVRQHFPGKKLNCVFGCGGDRDKSKRAMMGEIAERLADEVILTSDNPRSEDPSDILAEIEKGMTTQGLSIVDRRDAILHAIGAASEEDVVLVAGKGHEDYQLLPEGRVPFSDYKVIADGLETWIPEDGKGE